MDDEGCVPVKGPVLGARLRGFPHGLSVGICRTLHWRHRPDTARKFAGARNAGAFGFYDEESVDGQRVGYMPILLFAEHIFAPF